MKNLFLLIIAFVAIELNILSQENKDNLNVPKIIRFTPELSDCNVDPAITEIIVEFDQDMTKGMSLVDCPNMPKINGETIWKDKRKLSIPVKLYADKLYQLALNNERFLNFKSESGIPLSPTVYYFHTKKLDSQKLNEKAFLEFSNYFLTNYSYFDLKGIDWKTKLNEHKSEFVNANTQSGFALKLYKFLQLTEDPHFTFESEGMYYIPSPMKLDFNFNNRFIFSQLSNFYSTRKWAVISGKYKNVAYLNIANWNNEQKNDIYEAINKLKEFKDEPDIIIDVRNNSGGNESLAKEFASCFITDSLPYEKTLNYNESTGKFDKEHIKYLYPGTNGISYSGNVYVLTGKKVMSSNESFVLMMKLNKKATTIGSRTYGSSGNPHPYVLSNNITVNIPSWKAYTLDGKLIEGNGIEPDMEISFPVKDYANADPLLDKVVDMIKEKNPEKYNKESELTGDITNLEKNLFDGNNYGELSFVPMTERHIKRLIFNINNPWLRSDLVLKKDSIYYIVVTGFGSTSRRKIHLWSGPEGATTNYKLDHLPSDSIAPFSIIGKLGITGKIFSMAKPIELKPDANNELFVGFNDGMFEDNIGYFIVDIFKGKKEDVLKNLEENKKKIGQFYGETKEK